MKCLGLKSLRGGILKGIEWFKKKKDARITIVERSNVIQYDDMGYPLRLCVMGDGKQAWIDTHEHEGDVVLNWGSKESEGEE